MQGTNNGWLQWVPPFWKTSHVIPLCKTALCCSYHTTAVELNPRLSCWFQWLHLIWASPLTLYHKCFTLGMQASEWPDKHIRWTVCAVYRGHTLLLLCTIPKKIQYPPTVHKKGNGKWNVISKKSACPAHTQTYKLTHTQINPQLLKNRLQSLTTVTVALKRLVK